MRYFFLAFCVILMASCDKTPKINHNRASELRVGKWHVTSGTLTLRKPNGLDTTLNYMDWIPTCHKDDYIKFDSLNRGYIFPGGTTCDASQADSSAFVWQLKNGETILDLYNGFSNTFGVVETIVLPYFSDTISKSPLILDTLVGAIAAAAMTPPGVVVIDSFWKLHFDSSAVQRLDIYNATITNYSQSAFTINYAVISTYPDSTGHHTGFDVTNNIDMDPIIRPDTFHYSVTYTNF